MTSVSPGHSQVHVPWNLPPKPISIFPSQAFSSCGRAFIISAINLDFVLWPIRHFLAQPDFQALERELFRCNLYFSHGPYTLYTKSFMLTLPPHQTGTSSVEDLPVVPTLSCHESKRLRSSTSQASSTQYISSHHTQLAMMAPSGMYPKHKAI